MDDYVLIHLDEQTEEKFKWCSCTGKKTLTLQHGEDRLAHTNTLGRPKHSNTRVQDGEFVIKGEEEQYERLSEDGVGVLKETRRSTTRSRKGVKEEERTSHIVKRVMGVEECLRNWNMRYVAYCLLMADIYWKMLMGQEAVQVCSKAMHALVYRQQNYFDTSGIDDSPEGWAEKVALEDSIDYVWRKMLKYVNESRLSRTGKVVILFPALCLARHR